MQKIYRNRAQELENVISRVVLVLDKRGYLVDTGGIRPQCSPPIPGQTWEPELVTQSPSGIQVQNEMCAHTAERLLPMISKDKGEQEAFCPFVTEGHRNKEPGVRKEWRKIICLKAEDGETAKMNSKDGVGKKYRSQMSKLPLGSKIWFTTETV